MVSEGEAIGVDGVGFAAACVCAIRSQLTREGENRSAVPKASATDKERGVFFVVGKQSSCMHAKSCGASGFAFPVEGILRL